MTKRKNSTTHEDIYQKSIYSSYRYQEQVDLLERDEYGLVRNINYSFGEDGKIDWQRLIDERDFVPNKLYFQKKNKDIPETAEGLSDKEKLVLLRGYKRLSHIRGFTSVKYIPIGYAHDEVVVSCEIVWIPNYESQMQSITYSSIGNASTKNTDDFFSKFLGPLAENRAFVKCVRSFLNIPVYGYDEFTPEDKKEEINNNEVSLHHPLSLLSQKLREKGKSFSQLKVKLIKENSFNPEIVNGWETEKDIPVSDIIRVLGILS